MKNKIARFTMAFAFLLPFIFQLHADNRSSIYSLGLELERKATELAQGSFDHFKGWSGTISDQEQAILFKSEAFSASCRLFLRLAETRSDYFRQDFLRTNLYNAFIYLVSAFRGLEEEMRRGGIMPYALSDCRKILDRMDYEFSKWPSVDNLSFLHQKYVKARNATVYMIERRGTGVYVRHAFKNLESLFRYNYDLKRERDPWKYLVEVPSDTLEKMEEGEMIDLTFEGMMVIEKSNRSNRPVYLIRDGQKHGLTSPNVVQRLGGWSKVFEIPREIIIGYPEGDPID